jgi:hypothetical protein
MRVCFKIFYEIKFETIALNSASFFSKDNVQVKIKFAI